MNQNWFNDELSNSTKILVSVIVPVYNVKPYLREALDSVINQTYKNLEIFLVDDGSDDGSGDICDEYAKKDLRIKVYHQSHKGLSAARNIGLERMNGQAVAFLDSDDAFCPEMIEVMVTAMLREHADIVVCKCAVFYTKGNMLKRRRIQKRPTIQSRIYDSNSAMSEVVDWKLDCVVWNKLYQVTVWDSIRFPEGRIYEDRAVILPILDQTKSIYVLPDCLYLHRKRPGSITASYSKQGSYDWFLAIRDFDEFVEQHYPGVFTEKQFLKTRWKRIGGMIEYYLQVPYGWSDLKEKEQFREQILELGSGISKEEGSMRVLCALWMLRHCPTLLNVVFPVFRLVLTGKRRILLK